MGPARAALAWAALGMAIVLPISVAAKSPLLAWRDPVYIAASLAGVIAMALLLLQPLLAAGHLPGLRLPRGRRLNRWTGAALVGAILVHVAGLWVTSPPDVIDALMFTSPTPFASWGVIAMWPSSPPPSWPGCAGVCTCGPVSGALPTPPLRRWLSRAASCTRCSSTVRWGRSRKRLSVASPFPRR